MDGLKQLEEYHYQYAQVIEDIIKEPRSNEQLVSLCESTVRYLRQSGDILSKYNDKIETFMGLMYRLP